MDNGEFTEEQLTEEKFTNDAEILYPELDDKVDVRVLNNNTRLLDEKKVDYVQFNELVSDNLDGVAKETSVYSIEDGVNAVKTTANTINTTVSGINATANTINTTVSGINTTANTINTNVSSIKSTADTINTNVNAIKTTTSTINTTANTINTTVSGINTTANTINTNVSSIKSTADTINTNVNTIKTTTSTINTTANTINTNVNSIKTTATSIDGKISSLEDKISAIDERTELWWENPSSIVIGKSTKYMTIGVAYDVLSLSGSGYLSNWRGYKNALGGVVDGNYNYAQCKILVTVDGATYLNATIDMTFSNIASSASGVFNLQLLNGQYNPWNAWADSSVNALGPRILDSSNNGTYLLPGTTYSTSNYVGYHLLYPSSSAQTVSISLSNPNMHVNVISPINKKGIEFNSSLVISFTWVKHSTDTNYYRYLECEHILRGK